MYRKKLRQTTDLTGCPNGHGKLVFPYHIKKIITFKLRVV
jgi:hypothetical protein